VGFLPSHLRLLIRSHQKFSLRGPVCTLGNQETWASYAELKDIFAAAKCEYRQVREVRTHTSKMFSDDPALAEVARDFVHAKVFFEMLGMEEYMDIDAFDFDQPSLLHDLNQPVPAQHRDTFGTVIDGGTIEHIFDTRQALENTAQLLRVGGHVVHMASFEMDHGFYSFSPCLLYDFYAANGFADLECFILQFDYNNILDHFREPVPCFQYSYGMSLDGLFDPARKPAIFFVARKDRHLEKPALPFQGIYSRKAGLRESFDTDAAAGGQVPKSRFEALVPERLQRPLAPVRPLLALANSRLTSYLDKRKRLSRMERI
jgi:hypothetical protein